MVIESKVVLDKAAKIVYNMCKDVEAADYDSPSWAYKQADANGYNRAIMEVYRFLNLSDHDK